MTCTSEQVELDHVLKCAACELGTDQIPSLLYLAVGQIEKTMFESKIYTMAIPNRKICKIIYALHTPQNVIESHIYSTYNCVLDSTLPHWTLNAFVAKCQRDVPKRFALRNALN